MESGLSPSFSLHEVHSGTAALVFNELSVPALLAAVASGQYSPHGTQTASRSAVGMSYAAFFADRSLNISDGSNTFRVPLGHTEVGYSCSQDSSRILIAVALRLGMKNIAWILETDGSEKLVRETIQSIGETGALRTDFHTSFNMDTASVVGEGSFGKVLSVVPRSGCLCSSWDEGSLVAVKTVSSRAEAAILVDVQQHPNIVRFVGIFASTDGDLEYADALASRSYLIVMQCCLGGNLYSQVMGGALASSADAAQVAHGLLSALEHIHQCGIVHRDVKAENVLLGGDGRDVVLTDFGLAARAEDDEEMRRQCGSLGYVAPEVLVGERYDAKIDMFGAGVVFFFMLTRGMPWPDGDRDAIWQSTIRCDVGLDDNTFAHMCPIFKKLIKVLLQRQPENRPNAKDILEQWVRLAYASGTLPENKAYMETSFSIPMVIERAGA